MKKFKTKNKSIIPYIIILFICAIVLKNLTTVKIVESNKNLINSLLNKSFLSNIKINMNPYSILKNKLLYDDQKYLKEVLNYNYDSKASNPQIYIYNPHSTQKFSDYDVILTSYILNNKLKIDSYVEKTNFEELNEINSENIIDEYIKKWNNPKLIIALEIGNNEKIKIKNKKYSKVNILSGNEILLNKLTSYLKEEIISNKACISNLDINTITIQIGNEQSNLEEIINTLEDVAIAIEKYIGDTNER